MKPVVLDDWKLTIPAHPNGDKGAFRILLSIAHQMEVFMRVRRVLGRWRAVRTMRDAT